MHIEKSLHMQKELQLYIHIPFCVSKCAYCDFLSAPGKPEQVETYLEALMKEIESCKVWSAGYQVSTVFIGGGTPSILNEMQVERLFESIRHVFILKENAEISIEINPGAVSEGLFACYKRVGINRLSIGLQSIHHEELLTLGRIHTYQDFRKTYDTARTMDFDNINVDLMSALPGQTFCTWEKTLKEVADLQPEHISAYSLIIEPGTLFYTRYHNSSKTCPQPNSHDTAFPDEEQEYIMYQNTEEILKTYGYHRYEISNYAKKGCECRHNLGYWERKEYLGLGLGASSLMNETRWSNVEHMEQYLGIIKEAQKQLLTLQEQIEETMFLGLRKSEGVSLKKFQKQYKKTVFDVYGRVIREMSDKGFLICQGDCLKLTKRGVDLSNYVMAQFLEMDC